MSTSILNTSQETVAQHQNMRAYYRFHAKIYDLTRWSFLFGRSKTIKRINQVIPNAKFILEIGCGTGKNLVKLGKLFPEATIVGLDVSQDMAELAQKKMTTAGIKGEVINKPYLPEDPLFSGKPDVILFSYSLTMINPHWKDLIIKAHQDLKPGGIIAVTDFHDSKFLSFQTHMANNHVRMEGHILPELQELFAVCDQKIGLGYGGIWRYFRFLGQK